MKRIMKMSLAAALLTVLVGASLAAASTPSNSTHSKPKPATKSTSHHDTGKSAHVAGKTTAKSSSHHATQQPAHVHQGAKSTHVAGHDPKHPGKSHGQAQQTGNHAKSGAKVSHAGHARTTTTGHSHPSQGAHKNSGTKHGQPAHK